jgi:hypothetical protein
MEIIKNKYNEKNEVNITQNVCKTYCSGDKLLILEEDVDTKKSVQIQVKFSLFLEVLSKIYCGDNYNIINLTPMGNFVYIFIQFQNKSNEYVLCIMRGKINTINIISDDSLIIQNNYNLYGTIKSTNLNKYLSKNLNILQVIYNKKSNLFMLLMECDKKTLIGSIQNLGSINYIGTMIEFIKSKDLDFVIINHSPKFISLIGDNKYFLEVFDNNKKCKKSYTLCL